MHIVKLICALSKTVTKSSSEDSNQTINSLQFGGVNKEQQRDDGADSGLYVCVYTQYVVQCALPGA
jgi:hypothetical protein